MGGGEITRYIGRHGSKRREGCADCRSAALMLKTAANAAACRSKFSQNAPVLADRQFFKDLTLPFYGYNRPGAKLEAYATFWHQNDRESQGAFDCIKAFRDRFRRDLKNSMYRHSSYMATTTRLLIGASALPRRSW
jgi:non-heme chloroperoxidase